MTELVLTVATYNGLPPSESMQFRLNDGVCVLGRRAGCDLELPDAECIVSGEHARVEMQGETAVITDLSTNGTYLNNAQQPIGQNEAVPLTDGDRLQIGPYEVTVSLIAAYSWCEPESTARRPRTKDLSPEMASPSDVIDLLGAATSSLNGPGTPFDSPLIEPAPPAGVPVEAPRPSVDQIHFALPTAPSTAAKAKGETSAGSSLERRQQSPPSPAVPEDYDLLSDAFNPWADDPKTPARLIDDLPNEATTMQEVEAVSEPSLQPPDELARTRPEARSHSPDRHQHQGQVQGCVGPASPELSAFLGGLGIANARSDVDGLELMRRSGALLRELTEGLMAVMRARAAFKSELRLEVTTIRARANNPFQFCVDAEDALDRLLLRPTPGFLDPDTAASKAFDDIQAHQMAIMAGLRAALNAIVSHFEPAKLQQRVELQKPLDRLLPGGQKAKCWEQFVAAFDQVSDDASEDFMRVFGDAFNRAYEDQVRRLAKARMQNEP